MRAGPANVFRETIRDRHPNETFEKALGRVVRKHEGTFAEYVALIGRVRERAAKDKCSLADAAKALAGEGAS